MRAIIINAKDRTIIETDIDGSLTTLQQILKLRSDSLGILVQNLWPVQLRESIGETLGPDHVLDPQKDIVVLSVAHVMGRQFASEPLVSVEIDFGSAAETRSEFAHGSAQSRDP